MLPITMTYAGALALVFLVLSVRVIQGRGKNKVFMGDGGNEAMLRLMRGHANFAEYVPLILILIGFLELRGLNATVLHALGASLLVARLLHGYTFAFTTSFFPGRLVGATLSLLVLGAAGALNLWMGLNAL